MYRYWRSENVFVYLYKNNLVMFHNLVQLQGEIEILALYHYMYWRNDNSLPS
jgi:hypothetical protein